MWTEAGGVRGGVRGSQRGVRGESGGVREGVRGSQRESEGVRGSSGGPHTLRQTNQITRDNSCISKLLQERWMRTSLSVVLYQVQFICGSVGRRHSK